MKNKKGISIGRIILYVLFLSLIALFIYTLFITFNAMKKKKIEDNSVNSSLRFAYNNQFDYSAADYIQSAYLNFCRSNSVARDIYYNVFNINYVDDLVFTYSNTDSSYVHTALPSVTQEGNNYPYLATGFVDDNVFHLGDMIKNLYNNAKAVEVEENNGNFVDFNYFTDFSNYRSAVIVINCDIPVELFNFSVSGNFNAAGCDIYFSGSSDTSSTIFKGGGYQNGVYNSSSLPSGFLSTYSRIKKLIFPIWQRYSDSEQGFYITPSPYNYNYLNVLSNFTLDLTFNVYTNSSDYQQGYDAGYQNGLSTGAGSSSAYIEELQRANNSLNSQISDLKSRVDQQSYIINHLNDELQHQSTNFKGLFFTFADIPFKTVSNALGFEFWGVNLFRFFVGVITALGILWLIKRLYK
jgi:hypothetical protein